MYMLCVHSMDHIHISYHHNAMLILMLMLESVNRNRVVAVAVAFVRLSFLVDHFIPLLFYCLLCSSHSFVLNRHTQYRWCMVRPIVCVCVLFVFGDLNYNRKFMFFRKILFTH